MKSIIVKCVTVSIVMFFCIVSLVWAVDKTTTCKGWACETAYCPNGYAIEVPGKGYLPCELFDDYVATENRSILR